MELWSKCFALTIPFWTCGKGIYEKWDECDLFEHFAK